MKDGLFKHETERNDFRSVVHKLSFNRANTTYQIAACYGMTCDQNANTLTVIQNGKIITQIDADQKSVKDNIFGELLKEKEKEIKVQDKCAQLKGWTKRSVELAAVALRASMSSVSFIRGEWDYLYERCNAVVDSPSGPVRCSVRDIYFDEKQLDYFASLGSSGDVQANCRK